MLRMLFIAFFTEVNSSCQAVKLSLHLLIVALKRIFINAPMLNLVSVLSMTELILFLLNNVLFMIDPQLLAHKMLSLYCFNRVNKIVIPIHIWVIYRHDLCLWIIYSWGTRTSNLLLHFFKFNFSLLHLFKLLFAQIFFLRWQFYFLK